MIVIKHAPWRGDGRCCILNDRKGFKRRRLGRINLSIGMPAYERMRTQGMFTSCGMCRWRSSSRLSFTGDTRTGLTR